MLGKGERTRVNIAGSLVMTSQKCFSGPTTNLQAAREAETKLWFFRALSVYAGHAMDYYTNFHEKGSQKIRIVVRLTEKIAETSCGMHLAPGRPNWP
jgi:hypothetical protein